MPDTHFFSVACHIIQFMHLVPKLLTEFDSSDISYTSTNNRVSVPSWLLAANTTLVFPQVEGGTLDGACIVAKISPPPYICKFSG